MSSKFLTYLLLGALWYGSVFCDYSNRQLHRELTKNQFDHVQLNYQNISHVTKDLLLELTMVQRLEIEHSNVRSIEPWSFERLINLKKLSLKHNMLREIRNEVFVSSSIQELDLSDNQIRTIDENAFRDTRNLRSIDLRNNKIEVYNNQWFINTMFLCFINLENNLIKAVPKRCIPFWPGLSCRSDFILSHNRIEEVSEEAFPFRRQFNKLYLDHNAITTIKNATFSQVRFVKDLKLDHNRIVCTTADVKKVEKIDVDNNPWNEECLLNFLQQKNVKATTHLPYVIPTRLPMTRIG